MLMKMAKKRSNTCFSVADIHTHILHSIDDGSSSIDESLALLEKEKSQGVVRVALTPHLDLESVSLDVFLKERDKKMKELLKAIKQNPELQDLILCAGAEVKYTPNITKCDVKKLKIEGTNHILLELPLEEPFYLEETLEYLKENKIVPIFAHVERCAFLRSKDKLKYYKNKGVIMQSNLSALSLKSIGRFVRRMIKKGYIDVLASDSHSLSKRPPLWDEALKFLKNTEEEKIKRNSLELFSDGKKQQAL